MKKIAVIALIIIFIAAGTTLFFIFKQKGKEPKFVYDKVSRADIKSVVTATGTVNAVITVQVGTQVSGTIKKLLVNFNSPVKKGQLLAQIDPEIFEAQVNQAKANFFVAQANLERSQVILRDATNTLDRNKILFARSFISKSDLDTAETNYLSAQAQVRASQAQTEQAKAVLDSSSINLKNTSIFSPVNGTVISRNIDVGQTVAASFQTPTLFTIAQDLTKMQIDTNVDEADIGKIKVGQNVSFTVDAYPEIKFPGKVVEIRNAPITIQNVVTYDTIISVDNTSLRLKPGMTANVSIEIEFKQNVLRVPNTALRFKMPIPPERKITLPKVPNVWTLENKKPKFVKITPGISDGNFTELVAGNLTEGQVVIVDIAGKAKKTGDPAAGMPRFIR